LPGRLKAALRAFRDPDSVTAAATSEVVLESVLARIKALEDIQTRREVEWAEVRSALDRMIRRYAALQAKAKGDDDDEQPAAKQSREQLRATLRAKGLLREG
jgi:hypothetical protein